MRPTQYFSEEYLQHCAALAPIEIIQFLEDFRLLHEESSPTKLISMRIPERLLSSFRAKCELTGVKYQTKIKKLMTEWL